MSLWRPLVSLLLPLLPALAAADVPAQGRALFAENCLLCHAAGGDLPGGATGPDLAGIVDRAGAAQADFAYSQALRDARLHWDRDTLDRFLAAPTRVVPGTTMTTAIADAAQRRALIAFLATTRAVAPAAAAEGDGGAAARRRSGDWDRDAPEVAHRIVAAELPPPYSTPSARKGSATAARRDGALPKVPSGLVVSAWAEGLAAPRRIRVAPNGDVFVAESASNRIRVLPYVDGAATAPDGADGTIYAAGLDAPFGMAFYPVSGEAQWLYVANRNSVVRYAYRSGDRQARGQPQTIVARLSPQAAGHATRDLQFSADGRALYIAVGSASNVAEGLLPKQSAAQLADWDARHGVGAAWGGEEARATVLVTDPLGRTPPRHFANGIRNCVGLGLQPASGALWCAVNERDGLGDDLVPDYVTRVREGAFYGWPWYYLGDHEDPRLAGARPELRGHVTVPDVLLQAHSAALGIVFYEGATAPGALPLRYRGDAFVALHGSWNRSKRTGYKVVRVPMQDGVPDGGYVDFMTGFVADDDHVRGRPAGVAIARDGALLVSDDLGGRIWRVAGQP
ncbi:PQQ-dependent sugar dehydrogenase [Solimonas soli]|uniref:PQQ-dependent sugar dehydrogenase n=1 Tax=Solimonas soli TaxID=413479 RepID=UPI0004B4808D|nr:PQQ-dependent sugar dehydrogenase [Solimonas soli]